MMGSTLFKFLLSVSLTMALMAFLIVVLSTIVGFFVRWRDINAFMQHPLLDQAGFKEYPFPVQAGIYLDYFLRILFPGATKGVSGNANLILKHVDPRKVPFSLRWPIVGFWGGLALGLFSQIAFFALMVVNQAA